MSQRKTIDPELTYKRAAELLRYDPDTGRIVWRVSRGTASAGDEAGCVREHCRTYYRLIRIDGNLYYGHRLAWLLVYGEWPEEQIDHIDGSGFNNGIANLRDVDRTMNLRNARMRTDNTSGVSGVCWDKTNGKWQVRIKINDKNKFLGYFDDLKEAAAARTAANLKYGFTARHGIRTY